MLTYLVRLLSITVVVVGGLTEIDLKIGLAQESSRQSSERSDHSTQNATRIFLQYDPVVGQPHPDFILPSISQEKQGVQLSSFRGKKVLLLHFASW